MTDALYFNVEACQVGRLVLIPEQRCLGESSLVKLLELALPRIFLRAFSNLTFLGDRAIASLIPRKRG